MPQPRARPALADAMMFASAARVRIVPPASPPSGRPAALAVVAICRDEAAAIAGFIDQFRPIGCEVRLLDTGSTDATVALARARGAHVESAGFTDFASARNEAIDRLGGSAEWIVMLDIDERLDPDTISHLPDLVRSASYDIYLAPLLAVHPDGARHVRTSKAFLFRHDPALRWVFKVHEKLVGSMRQALLANARIEHRIGLHDGARRLRAEHVYAALARHEPYFTDPAYRAATIARWPILDPERPTDDRIALRRAGPLVSVVIPTCDRRELLGRAVRSALAQDHAAIEVVVVGDADPVFEAHRRSFGDEPRVRLVNLDRNHGPGGAVPRNRGVALASGDLVAYLDDDNEWASDHVSSVVAAMLAAGASFGFSSMSVDGVDLGFDEPRRQGIDTSTIVHRKSLIERHGGWKGPEAGYAHDWELVERWLAGGERWVCTRRPTLRYNADTSRQRAFIAGLAARTDCAARPSRAGPLVDLARRHAAAGRHDDAVDCALAAREIAPDRADIAFVEHDDVASEADEIVSISGWYSADPTRRTAGRRAAESLAIDAHASHRRRDGARANLRWYAEPAATRFPGTRIVPIDVDLPAPCAATNPSFRRDGGGWLGVVRGVNYRIVDGRYDIRDPDAAVRTRNFLVRLDPALRVVAVREMTDRTGLARHPDAAIRGYEDCRLVRWRDRWWCSATARDVSPDARATMVLLALDDAGDIVEAHPLRGWGDHAHQKNWMPLAGERLRFVHACGPTVVLDASAGDGTVVVESGVDPGVAIDHWRGGSPLLPFDGGHLALVHESHHTPAGREYVHRFVAFDARVVPVAATDAFVFRERGIEFAAGLDCAPDGRTLVASFGSNDAAAFLACVPADQVRARLGRPFAGARFPPSGSG